MMNRVLRVKTVVVMLVLETVFVGLSVIIRYEDVVKVS